MFSVLEQPSPIELKGSRWTVDELRCLSASFEGRAPQDVLAWALSEFGDRLAIATGFGARGLANRVCRDHERGSLVVGGHDRRRRGQAQAQSDPSR